MVWLVTNKTSPFVRTSSGAVLRAVPWAFLWFFFPSLLVWSLTSSLRVGPLAVLLSVRVVPVVVMSVPPIRMITVQLAIVLYRSGPVPAELSIISCPVDLLLTLIMIILVMIPVFVSSCGIKL